MAMKLPDLTELDEWGDPTAVALQRSLQRGFAAVMEMHQHVCDDAAKYAPSLGLYAMERLQSDLVRLEELVYLLKRFRRTGAWVVVAVYVRQHLADLAQYVQVDIAALHGSMQLDPNEQSKLESACASAFGVHQSQYAAMVDDCRKMLQALLEEQEAAGRRIISLDEAMQDGGDDEARRAAILGEASTKRIVLNEKLPMYQAIVSAHRNALLAQLSAVTAPNELLTSTQRDIVNDEFVDSVVGFLHLYQRLLSRFTSYKEDAKQHQKAMKCEVALKSIHEELEKLPTACSTTTYNAVEVLLNCEIVVNSVGQVLKWCNVQQQPGSASPVKDTHGNVISTNYLHQQVGPANSRTAHQFVVRQLMLLPKYVQECVQRLKQLQESLNVLQKACEQVTLAMSQVIETHATTLFTLAQGIAAVLKDSRKLDDTLRDLCPRLEELVTTPTRNNDPEAVAKWWTNDVQNRLLIDGGAIDSEALGRHLMLVATTCTSLRHGVSQVPQSIEFLTQAMSGLSDAVGGEASRTQRTIQDVTASLATLQTSGADNDFDSGRSYVTAPLLIEGITATMMNAGGNRPSADSPSGMTVATTAALHPSDRQMVGNMLLDLVKEYTFVESRLLTLTKKYVAANDPLMVASEQAVAALCTSAELLGQALFLNQEVMQRIGTESAAIVE